MAKPKVKRKAKKQLRATGGKVKLLPTEVKLEFKGKEIIGFIPYKDILLGPDGDIEPFQPLPLTPPPPSARKLADEAREKRQTDHWTIHYTAIANLWKAALAELEFGYMDPRARVEVGITSADFAVRIDMTIRGNRNTSNQEFTLNTLTHATLVRMWPGKTLAQKYLAAMFASLMAHEGFELVTKKNVMKCYRCATVPTRDCARCHQNRMVVDAHDELSYHQQMLGGNKCNVQRLLVWALGEAAYKMLDDESYVAYRELAKEVDYLTQGVNYD